MGTPRRIRRKTSQLLPACALLLYGSGNFVLADPPASADPGEPKTLPQTSFFSSIKQSLRMGYDHEVVRGHFDLGSPPNTRRYYCLVDTKTHAKEPIGVLGQPVPLPDGTTGLKIDSVSLYACNDAEKQGMLVTTGYVLNMPSGAATASRPAPAATAAAAPPPPVAAPPLVTAPPAVTASPAPPSVALSPAPAAQLLPPAAAPATVAGPPAVSLDMIDVAGVKLGMSLDEVRAVLKSKKLREYNESTETLGYLDSEKGVMQSIPNGRFVNVIAAWTPPAAGDTLQADGESYEIMFTPMPGRERVMAIVHSVGYSPANAVHETALEDGLMKKYGGFSASNSLPESPTWRFQGGGNVQVGDPCNRRELFGGIGGLNVANKTRGNIALKDTPDELQFQLDRCGAAIVTEDHVTANGGALRADRLVTRFTVTAYSPSNAVEGARAAAQLIQAAKGNAGEAPRAKDQTKPNL